MNVASLELCKELYQLSGWDNAEAYWFKYGRHLSGDEEVWDVGPGGDYPAYDLGYLLRRLKSLLAKNQWLDIRINERGEDYYVAAYGTYEQGHLQVENADNPEDAACLLAIELLKVGVVRHD